MYYVKLDVMGDGVPEWATSFGCSAEPIDDSRTQHPSYRISADSHEELEALLADGGYPGTFIHFGG
jgi:hypothetical protein